MKPIIGMFAKIYENDLTTEMYYQYHEAVEKAGGVPVLLPYVKEEDTIDAFIELCDGFFITGGVDVEPTRYGDEKKETCGEIETKRDELEFRAFEKMYKTNKPILGICRGMQVINAALGGKLYQDIPTEVITDINHRQPREFRFRTSHDILVEKNTPLYEITKKERITGNSFHHQSVKVLGKGLEAFAYADDGIIEGFYSKEYPYLRGYQWHPERLVNFDEDNFNIFSDFINEVKKVKKN